MYPQQSTERSASHTKAVAWLLPLEPMRAVRALFGVLGYHAEDAITAPRCKVA